MSKEKMTTTDLQALLTVRAHLDHLLKTGQITQAQHDGTLEDLTEGETNADT